MRFYFRLARGIGVSMPWWLAIILYLFWAMGLIVVAIFAGLMWLVRKIGPVTVPNGRLK